MKKSFYKLVLLWSIGQVLFSHYAFAQTEPSAWLVPAPNFTKEAYFSNLADGDTIETPFLVKFGLSGMGLAAISGVAPETGHHHLLVNRDLPLNFKEPLPFNDQYIHFGKGQMETVLTFNPGKYTLRLVLADHNHIPYFVYSKPIHVNVIKRNNSIDPKSLLTQGVSILSPKDGENLHAPFKIMFHASGYNVSNTAVAAEGNGHFKLRIQASGGHETIIEFKNGRTEAWLNPPSGRYSTQLEFVNNVKPFNVLASSALMRYEVHH